MLLSPCVKRVKRVVVLVMSWVIRLLLVAAGPLVSAVLLKMMLMMMLFGLFLTIWVTLLLQITRELVCQLAQLTLRTHMKIMETSLMMKRVLYPSR